VRRRRAILPSDGALPAIAGLSRLRADQAGQRSGQPAALIDADMCERGGRIDVGDVENVVGADVSDAVERDEQIADGHPGYARRGAGEHGQTGADRGRPRPGRGQPALERRRFAAHRLGFG
jgi:hypothetical protein